MKLSEIDSVRDAARRSTSRRVAGHSIRPTILFVAIASLAATVVAATVMGVSGWLIALGLLAPDLVPLVAFRRPEQPGRMPRSMVPLYNATHSLVGPLVLLSVGVLLFSPVAGVVAGSWLTHIVGDRAVGYGLRTADGQNRNETATHPVHAAAGIPQR